MIDKNYAPRGGYVAVETKSRSNPCKGCAFTLGEERCLFDTIVAEKSGCFPDVRPDGANVIFVALPCVSTWVTEIYEYNGLVYTRDVGPNDTTVFCIDRVLAEVPWLPGDKGPDHHAIAQEMAKLGKEWLY